MRRFASKDSKRDSIYYIRWFLGLLRGLFIISLRGMESLWCGVMTGFRSI